MRGPAAVHEQGGSGDLRRFVRAQEDSKGAELLYRDELLGRLGLEPSSTLKICTAFGMFLTSCSPRSSKTRSTFPWTWLKTVHETQMSEREIA